MRLWHLTLLPLLVALAYVNVRDQRITDPLWAAVAIAGFVLYGAIAWWLWSRAVPRWAGSKVAKVLARKVGVGDRTIAAAAYLVVMAALFLLATWIYVYLEVNLKR